MSLIQKLEEEAVDAAKQYLEAKNTVGFRSPEADQISVKRGILRGVVIGVAMIRCPYELRDDRAKTLKRMEREFIRKAMS